MGILFCIVCFSYEVKKDRHSKLKLQPTAFQSIMFLPPGIVFFNEQNGETFTLNVAALHFLQNIFSTAK